MPGYSGGRVMSTVGWSRAYKRRVNALARAVMHGEGVAWIDALSRAVSQLQCGAKTARDGHGCRRKGRGAGGRCELHGGLSTGARTPEGRARLSQKAQSQLRDRNGHFLPTTPSTT